MVKKKAKKDDKDKDEEGKVGDISLSISSESEDDTVSPNGSPGHKSAAELAAARLCAASTHKERRSFIAREKPPTELQKKKERRTTISLDLAKKATLLAKIQEES